MSSTTSRFGPWTPRMRIFSMSAVRLGPVTITNSPRAAGSAARGAIAAQAAGKMLGQLVHPGDHHARRRQVARAADPGPWGRRSGTSRCRPAARRPRSRSPKARPCCSRPGARCQSARRLHHNASQRPAADRRSLRGPTADPSRPARSIGPGSTSSANAAARPPSWRSGSLRRGRPPVPWRIARPSRPAAGFCRGQTSRHRRSNRRSLGKLTADRCRIVSRQSY